jgi:hypothetical protein
MSPSDMVQWKIPKPQGRSMRYFDTGATRDDDKDKLDPEGFLHPLFILEFSRYMHKHRFQADGHLRDSDNWQKGIPADACMKSAWRHFLDWWLIHRGEEGVARESLKEALMAIVFNVQAYILPLLKEKDVSTSPKL